MRKSEGLEGLDWKERMFVATDLMICAFVLELDRILQWVPGWISPQKGLNLELCRVGKIAGARAVLVSAVGWPKESSVGCRFRWNTATRKWEINGGSLCIWHTDPKISGEFDLVSLRPLKIGNWSGALPSRSIPIMQAVGLLVSKHHDAVVP